jgi:hypothetical protein
MARIEFATLDGFHYREIIVRDGQPELVVLASKFGAFDWPHRIFFDEKTWYFSSQDALKHEEASHYGGKALYNLKQPEDQNAKIVNKDNAEVTPVVYPIQYFVVDASWDNIDVFPEFLKRGYWKNQYELTDTISASVLAQMQIGDRLAVKKQHGKGSPTISIRALGIITDIDPDGFTVYVKWIVQFKTRQVSFYDCDKIANGPYILKSAGKRSNWLRQIFSI